MLITGGAVRDRASSASLFVAVFIVEFAPDVDAQRPAAGRAAAGERAVGGLRAARRPRRRAVHRQPPDQRAAEGLGRRRHLADRLQPAGGGPDPHGDDRADHDLDLRRRPARGAARLARGLARRWASTAGGPSGRSPSGPPARRSSPAPCWRPPARSARRSCSRWSRARSASRRTRPTARSSSSSPRGRSRATIIKNIEELSVAADASRRCSRSRPSCCSPPRCSRSPAGRPSSR